MVKPLSFKGEKKSRKRKAPDRESTKFVESSSSALVALNSTTTPDVTTTEAVVVVGDDSWVTAEAPTDIIGPIIFVLPSQPATCIACDANGKVFTSELENIVEGDIRTAEPHDVRQVWVVSKVAGTENISFKGHHGRYEISSLFLPPPFPPPFPIRADLFLFLFFLLFLGEHFPSRLGNHSFFLPPPPPLGLFIIYTYIFPLAT